MKNCINTTLKVIGFFPLWIVTILVCSLSALDKPLFLGNNPAILRLWWEFFPMIATLLINLIFTKIIEKGNIKISMFGNVLNDSILGTISVKKAYWKNGVGSAVVEELIRFAKEYGKIKNISLGVKASNKDAIMLYEKFGFQKIGLHKNYFNVNGNFYDEIIMDLYI